MLGELATQVERSTPGQTNAMVSGDDENVGADVQG